MSNLDKVSDKSSGTSDWGNHLQTIWKADVSRPWDTYSKKTFSRFWDNRNSVDVEVKVKVKVKVKGPPQ